MLRTVLTLVALCGVVQSSGVNHATPIANEPVVTASSSQYFERIFNRLVAPPVFVEPAVKPQQFIPVQPVQHLQPVPKFQSVVPIQPVQPVQPLQPQPVEPNVAIAIATANAAAPVATILLPPYPFGYPPSFGFIPQEQANDYRAIEETTTQKPTTEVDVKTTKESESTTQMPDGSDDIVVQALPSNQDESQVNFRQYLGPSPPPSNQNVNFKQYAPSPLPSNQDVNLRHYLDQNLRPQRPQHHLPLALPHHHHHHHHHPHKYIHVQPQKIKTVVEVQKVPLAYIAPPPLPHFEHNHQAIKVVKHIHSFVPSKAKLIIRPVLKTRSISVDTGYQVPSAGYRAPVLLLRNVALRSQNGRPFKTKEMEPTTFRPIPIPNTKPPRL